MKSVLGSLLVVFLLFSVQNCAGQGKWTVVGNHLAQILMGVSFSSGTEGWIAGATSGVGPLILYTSNSGANWTNQNHETDALIFMDIDMYSSTNGFVSGLGVGKIVGSAYTTNGNNWTETTTKHLEQAFQSVGQISVSNVWQVGTWGNLGDLKGDGVMTSSDGGQTFTGYDWNQISLARYGSFISPTVGWIAGGQFPESNSTESARELTQHLTLGKDGILRAHPVLKADKSAEDNNTFAAVIASTTNGGKSFTTLYTNVGNAETGFYFNAIDFVSSTEGWVVGEGINATNGFPYSFIWSTTNGGSTWTQQLYLENTSLIQIQMTSATEGWAVGGSHIGSLSQMKGLFFQTTNGQTWTENGSVRDAYILDISAVDDTAYAVGLTILDVCDVYKYIS